MPKLRLGVRHIEAFRAVMSTNSMTVAARAMHTSQPQVSRLVAQLETITQFPLFERNGSRLGPTQDGLRFFREVERTFAGLAELESVAANIRSFSAARLSVAAMPRLAGDLLVKVVAEFHAAHPDVLVSIHSGNAVSVKDWVRSGFCDTGLALLTGEAAGINVESIATLRCVAVLPKGHPLCRWRKLKPAHFANQRFIAPTGESLLRSTIDDVFAAQHVPRHIVAEASLGSSVCAMVRAGMGISLVNPLAARDEFLNGGIEIRPFTVDIPNEVALLYPTYQAQARLVTAFAQIARPVIRHEMAAVKRAASQSDQVSDSHGSSN
ncbi:LysR substrate-binding domain-containing protein [Paraburkholderia caffeinilytica]|uniref:LysR substrate-binding domain-containing protein n=1 Tax=Paraburkholderia caffeinilytica TaxID=1761016 RepID=UPI003DA0A75A